MQTEIKNHTSAVSFLQGGGEMGELIHSYPWEQTPIGRMESWPQSLRTTLSILLNSRFPMFLFWGDDLTCFYNDAFRPSLGVNGKHPSALGRPGVEVWEEIWDIIKPWIDQILSGGPAIWMEDQLVPFYRNGQIEQIYWTFSYSPVSDETGKPAGVFVTCTETTEKVVSFKKLETVSQQFRDLVMQAPVAIAVFRGEDFIAEIANDAYLPIVGKTREEFIGKPLFESLPETREILEPLAKEVMRTGIPFPASEFEIMINRYGRDERCFFNSIWEPLVESDGSINGFIAVAHEITGQVMARKKAEESEARFRSLIEQAPIATCLFVGAEMRIEVANEIMIRYWGKDRSVLGMPLAEALPELKDQPFPGILQKVYATGIAHHEFAAPAQLVVDGKMDTYYFDYTYQPVRNAEGDVYGIMDMAIEVTEQVLARQQVEQAEEKVRLAIDSAELGTYEINLVTNEMKTSERFNEIWGVPHALSRPEYAEYIHPDDRETRKKAHEESLRTGNLNYEGRLVWKDGSVHWVRIKGKVLYDVNDKPATLLGVIQDITEQKLFADSLTRLVNERTHELENKNKELERSNANLEEFAHAASHDLKEPIRKIHFFTDRLKNLLSDRLSEDEKFTFSRIENASQRMNALIDDLLLYSHVSQRPHEMEDVDLNVKLGKVLEDLELEIQQKSAVIVTDKLPVVKGYRRQLQQLFQNLISNALKYNKPDTPPRINISYRLIQGKESGLALPEPEASKPYHFIEINDNGIGFNQSESDRIFQMFQRLHGNTEYRGTGVGLAIARKVVENHKGFIYAKGQPGIGSSFYIGIPANDPEP